MTYEPDWTLIIIGSAMILFFGGILIGRYFS